MQAAGQEGGRAVPQQRVSAQVDLLEREVE
jgi:hypothetical protein